MILTTNDIYLIQVSYATDRQTDREVPNYRNNKIVDATNKNAISIPFFTICSQIYSIQI